MGKQGEREPRTETKNLNTKKGEGRSKEERGDGQRPSEPE